MMVAYKLHGAWWLQIQRDREDWGRRRGRSRSRSVALVRQWQLGPVSLLKLTAEAA